MLLLLSLTYLATLISCIQNYIIFHYNRSNYYIIAKLWLRTLQYHVSFQSRRRERTFPLEISHVILRREEPVLANPPANPAANESQAQAIAPVAQNVNPEPVVESQAATLGPRETDASDGEPADMSVEDTPSSTSEETASKAELPSTRIKRAAPTDEDTALETGCTSSNTEPTASSSGHMVTRRERAAATAAAAAAHKTNPSPSRSNTEYVNRFNHSGSLFIVCL